MFIVGCYYRTQAGRVVRVIKENTTLGYESVQCDDYADLDEASLPNEKLRRSDGGWRYNRPGDYGRVCGSDFNFSHPANLLPGEVRPPRKKQEK